MRLTFRRLLAYLDGVLEEQDVEVVGQKISESEFASRLIHRIRNAKSRMRLGAPRLTGTGMGLDPNTVAEYLDYTLDEQRVPDFEKVCFESDVHLAEVSASHEILTLVLAEPAQVERSIRERIYGLPEEARRRPPTPVDEPTRTGSPEAAAELAAATQEANAMREVSEYLDDRSEWRWRSGLLTVALSFLLVLVGLRAIGPFNGTHPLLGRMLARGPQTPTAKDFEDLDIAPTLRAEDVNQGDTVRDSEAPLLEAPALESVAPPVPTSSEPPYADSAAPPAPANVETEVPAPAAPGPVEPEPAGPEPSVPAPVEPMPVEPMPVEPVTPVEPGDTAEPTAPPLPPAPAETVTVEPPVAPAVEVGKHNSPKTVLARYDKASDLWMRVPEREVLHSGDLLRVPPVYRVQIAMPGGLQMTVIGPAELRMLAPVDGRPSLAIGRGKLLVESVATANVAGDFNLNGVQGTLVLKSTDALVAIHVDRVMSYGGDPATSRRLARLTTVSGEAQWTSAAGQATTLAAAHALTHVDDSAMAPVATTPPVWVEPKRDWQMGAIEDAEREFAMDRPVSLTLEELLSHRAADIQSIAAQALASFGDFRPVMQSFRDDNKDRFWSDEFDALRGALAYGEPATAALMAALNEEFGGDKAIVDRLYRLCIGFNNEQLMAGEAAKLVNDLSNDEMAVRVLAIENLRRITGKTRSYLPMKTPDRQQKEIGHWQKMLDDGEIKWAAQPDELR
ncbi:MAG: hypothetical protein KDB14_26335 [Planctomycetales bacterium]|nr:hypothetical protein [Planctomycetales bacterium]